MQTLLEKDELVSDILMWTPSHGQAKLEPIYNSSVPIQVVAQKTSQERRTIKTGGDRGSRRSVLAVRHDDDEAVLATYSKQSLEEIFIFFLIYVTSVFYLVNLSVNKTKRNLFKIYLLIIDMAYTYISSSSSFTAGMDFLNSLSCYPFLYSITNGRSSRLHLVSLQNCRR